jgi:hypothetical protein
LQRVGEVLARGGARQRLSVLPIEGDGFIHDLAELGKHLPLVFAMAAPALRSKGTDLT